MAFFFIHLAKLLAKIGLHALDRRHQPEASWRGRDKAEQACPYLGIRSCVVAKHFWLISMKNCMEDQDTITYLSIGPEKPWL